MVPLGIFGLSFIPFLGDGGAAGIVENVFKYASMDNAPFWRGIAPALLIDHIPKMVLFLGALLLCGLAWRDLPPLECAVRYIVAVVVFSPAIANQYLAIPLAAIAVHGNGLYFAYVIGGAVGLVFSADGLHWPPALVAGTPYRELVLLLFLGFLRHVLPQVWVAGAAARASDALEWLRSEIAGQIQSLCASRDASGPPPPARKNSLE